jgi:hypothetical protein
VHDSKFLGGHPKAANEVIIGFFAGGDVAGAGW